MTTNLPFSAMDDQITNKRLTLSKEDRKDRRKAILERLFSFADKKYELEIGVLKKVADEFNVDRSMVGKLWRRELTVRAEEVRAARRAEEIRAKRRAEEVRAERRAAQEKTNRIRKLVLGLVVPEKRAILRHLYSISENNELEFGDLQRTADSFNVCRKTVSQLWKKALEAQAMLQKNKYACSKESIPTIRSPLQVESDRTPPHPPPMLEEDRYHQDHDDDDTDTQMHNYDEDEDAVEDNKIMPFAAPIAQSRREPFAASNAQSRRDLPFLARDEQEAIKRLRLNQKDREDRKKLIIQRLSSFADKNNELKFSGVFQLVADEFGVNRSTVNKIWMLALEARTEKKANKNKKKTLKIPLPKAILRHLYSIAVNNELQPSDVQETADLFHVHRSMVVEIWNNVVVDTEIQETTMQDKTSSPKESSPAVSSPLEGEFNFPSPLPPPMLEENCYHQDHGNDDADTQTHNNDEDKDALEDNSFVPFAASIAHRHRELFAAPFAQSRHELFDAPTAPIMRKAAEVYLANDPIADNGDYGLEFVYATQSEILPQSSNATARTFPRPDLFPPPSNCILPIKLIDELQNPFLASRTVGSLVKWKFHSADYALSIAFLEKGGCRHLVSAINKCLDIGTVKLKKIMQSNFTNNKQGALDKADEGGAPFLANCLTILTDILEASHHANSVTKALTHFQYAGACDAVCRVLLYHIKFIAQKNKMFADEKTTLTGSDGTDAENDEDETENKDEFVLNEKLVYRACCAIGHFAYPKLFEQHIVECLGINALLAALEAFPKRLKIQGAVCLALYNLANQSAPDSTTRAFLIQHLERGAVLDFVTKRVMDVLDSVNNNKLYSARSEKYIKDQVLKAGPVVLTFADKVKDCLLNDQGRSSRGQKEQKNMWLVVKRGENDEEDLY